MSQLQIQGTGGSNIAGVNVDDTVKIAPTQTPANAGYIKLTDVYGNKMMSDNKRICLAHETLLFYDSMHSSYVLNAMNWAQHSTTATVGFGNGIILNANNTVAVNTGCAVSSHLGFMPQKFATLRLTFSASTNFAGTISKTMMVGFTNDTTTLQTSPPALGVYFVWSLSGYLRCAVTGGAFTAPTRQVMSSPITMPSDFIMHDYEIRIGPTKVIFFIDNVVVATIDITQILLPTRLYLFAQLRVGGAAGGLAASVAPQFRLGSCTVSYIGPDLQFNYGQTQTQMGRGAYQAPLSVFAQTANHTNSVAPTSAALSNTAAAYTTLGGKFLFANSNGAVTDFIIFGYQNSGAAAAGADYRLFITGIRISSNIQTAVAGAVSVFDWSVAVGSSAISLATADASGPTTNTRAPRRLPIGVQAISVSDPIGRQLADVYANFADAPLVVEPNQFVHIIMQQFAGTALTTTFRGNVTITGWFE